MKKKVLLIAALFTAGISFTQAQMTSKKGTPILPEAGDYALGFNANSLTSYAGNLLNGGSNGSLQPLGLAVGATTITGKYFVDANKAYRGMLQLDFGSNTVTTPTDDLSAGAAAGAKVDDEVKTSNMGITIGGGIEMRRGQGRLQGVYGPMALIQLGSSSTENTYGNSLDLSPAGSSRNTSTKTGSTFGFGVGGFAGVEYFFAPKMSIGGEIMWTININSTGASETTTESYDGTATTSTTDEGGSSSSFNVGTTPMGNININFHF